MRSKAKKSGFLNIMAHLFSTCFRNFKTTFILSVCLSIISAFGMAVITPFKQLFFDSVSNAVGGNGDGYSAILFGLTMAGVMAVVMFIKGFDDVMSENLSARLQAYLSMNINKKAGKIAAINFEDSKTLDEINKAYKGLEGASRIFGSSISIIFYRIPYFIFMGVYLFSVKPILVFFILFAFLPSVVGQVVRYRMFANLERNIAPLRRKYEYYEKCINDREFAKETRILGGFWFFRNLYQISLSMACKKSWETTKKVELTELVIRFILLAGYVATIYIMYRYFVLGAISVGAFAAIFSSVDQMFDSMEYTVNYNINDITQNMGTMQNYMWFMEMEEMGGEDKEIEAKSICFKNVGFSYPNTNKFSVQNINLDIKHGETIAIVGENGAGKSTLAKLILGIYLPTHGSVLIDGEDTRFISPSSLHDKVSAVFQKYQRYKMKLVENISISQRHLPFSQEKMDYAISKSEIDLNDRSFANGLETMLSREFEGTDLSGGQWQRIAIARGFYRTHNMIVLDEPTAAIDPVEETRIYKLFADISKGKTSIIITHRLGSAKIADKIIIMDAGNIVDTGTHDELMLKGGLYKEMYNSQAKWYV